MRSNRANSKAPAQALVKDIRRATREPYSAEEKIRIALERLRGSDNHTPVLTSAEALSLMKPEGFLEAKPANFPFFRGA